MSFDLFYPDPAKRIWDPTISGSETLIETLSPWEICYSLEAVIFLIIKEPFWEEVSFKDFPFFVNLTHHGP